MPSSNSSLRARSNAVSLRCGSSPPGCDAMPKLSLYSRPSGSRRVSAADSYVPASQEPNMTLDAPAASARATSRGQRTPPSAHTCLPSRGSLGGALDARPRTAVGRRRSSCASCTWRPGPTPTLTMSAPASMSWRVPSAVTTLPATIGIVAGARRAPPRWPAASASGGRGRCRSRARRHPCSTSALALVSGSPLMPTATAIINRPSASRAGR